MIFHVFSILDDNPKQRLDDVFFPLETHFFGALGVGLFVHGSINYNQFYQHIPAFPQKNPPFSCYVAC
jgi:hypothetical protein